jgi:flagellar M-ring protein FliF
LYASIAVPRDYVLGIWQQENPEGDPTAIADTEMQSMENALKIDVERFVQNILPRLSLGEDEYRQVEVVFYDSLKRPAAPEPSLVENATAWAGRYWATASMIGLAVVSLLMLRSAIRPGASGPGGSEGGALQLDFGANEAATSEEQPSEEIERPKLRIKKSDSLKEDLSEMVREDPNAAANILRAWINNAG